MLVQLSKRLLRKAVEPEAEAIKYSRLLDFLVQRDLELDLQMLAEDPRPANRDLITSKLAQRKLLLELEDFIEGMESPEDIREADTPSSNLEQDELVEGFEET